MADAAQYPEILEELRAMVATALGARGIDSAEAHRASRDVVDLVRDSWGGQKIYIPRGTSLDVENMRQEILRRWDGTNTRELCREFGISERHLRRLYEEARARLRSV